MPKRSEAERILASPDTISHLLDCSRDTLIQWEQDGKLTEGIHFIKLGKQRRYIVPLMLDRLVNLHDDAAHGRAIANWLNSLLSNQAPPKRLPKIG